uniref:WW domain-containing protein n=1 Tax=Pyramimonas obovata TaxID=1411642 RepID=A0A7S0WN84_9CHLO|mmetsp:Transcript_31249/g.68272  ORF Transcript_31249/g.68272 Transcript_31249/m.68272 type:complete len:396 (+) Transcript_31249:203-1390(+)
MAEAADPQVGAEVETGGTGNAEPGNVEPGSVEAGTSDPSDPGALKSGMAETEPSPEEVVSMGQYLGVNVETGESYLMAVAKEAVIAPVLAPWQEMEDENGNPYFYNHRTKQSTRRHPLDTKFLRLVSQLRQKQVTDDSSRQTWMQFSNTGKVYYYNFLDGSTSETCPDGAEIPSLAKDFIPAYDASNFGVDTEIPGGAPSTRPRPKPDIVNRDGILRELVFKSWWTEDSEKPDRGNSETAGGVLEKRYMTIKFDVYAQTFEIHLDNEELVRLYNLSSVTAKNGKPIQCWDLYVGAKLNLLGKTTTLMQGDLNTLHWLDKHAKRLRKIKASLQGELRKYETRALAAAVIYEKGVPGRKGATSLRALLEQVEKLCATLAQFRPSVAQRYANQATAPP